MVNFFRIVLFILPMFFSHFARADVPAQDLYDMGAYGSSTTKDGACRLLSQYGYTVAPDGNSCQKPDGTNFYWVHSYTCTSGTLSGSTCVGAVAPVTCNKGSQDGYSSTTAHVIHTFDQTVACVDGCNMSIDDNFCVGTGADTVCIGRYFGQTGTACTASTPSVVVPSVTDEVKASCAAKGGSYISQNGVTSCVGRTVDGAQPTLAKASNTTATVSAAGTTNQSVQKSEYVDNSNNSITTNTTTTTNNPNGTSTTDTQSKKQDQKSFCEDNPNSNICTDAKKSTFAAGCPSSPCTGDAIQCAIAQRQQKTECEAQAQQDVVKSKSSFTTGEKLLNGQYDNDVQGFLNKDSNNSRTVSMPSSLSEDGQASYSSEGFKDVSVSVLGRTLSLPISKTNEYFNYFGFILLGLAYLSAYKIVTSGV